MAKLTKQAIELIKDGEESFGLDYISSLETDLDKLVEEFRHELISLGVSTLERKIKENPGTGKSIFRTIYPLRLERVGGEKPSAWRDHGTTRCHAGVAAVGH